MSEVQQLLSKFQTCKHRSPEEISKMIKRCSCQGGPYEMKGYFCYRKNILKLDPEMCVNCDLYESK